MFSDTAAHGTRRVELHLQLRLQSHTGCTVACKCKYRTSHVRLHLQLQLRTCPPENESVQTGNAEMYRRSGLVISREQGLRCDAGFAVPVLMPRWDMGMGRG